jgi:hypothetical protein
MPKSPSKILGRSLLWGLLAKAAITAYKLFRSRRAARAEQTEDAP